MRDFKATLREKVWLYDGSKGFLLIQRGLAPGEFPDLWNIERGREVYDIHRAYVDAGADIIQTNTLGASRFHLDAHGLYPRLSDINRAGVALAREAAMPGGALVAASVGPLGRLLEPFGELPFENAVDVFKEQIAALLDAGVDILHFETFTDLSELRAAVIAARELDPVVPVIATVSPESGGSTVMGDDAGCAAAVMSALGADCVGMNCGLAPRAMLSVFDRLSHCGAPLCAKPNAGSPELDGGKLRYGATEEEFYETAFGFAGLGARLVGGCCGSGPAHVRRLRAAVDAINASPEYGWAERAGRPAADSEIPLASARASATVSASELAACCREYLAAGARSAGGNGRPSEIGKYLFVDMSEFAGKSGDGLAADVVDCLCDADESDAAVSVFCLSGESSDGRVLAAVAENARTYHTKPLAFYSDGPSSGAINAALRRYCGVSAALVPARAADAARVGDTLYGAQVIRL